MTLALIAIVTILLSCLAVLAGAWILVRFGTMKWALIIFVAGLIIDVLLYVMKVDILPLSSILLIVTCTGLGTLVGWGMEHRLTLIIALIGAALSDLFSTLTTAGLTRQIVQDAAQGGRLLDYLTVSVPFGEGVLHVIGFADLAVLAIAMIGLRNQGVAWAPAFLAPFAGFLLALLSSFFTGWAPGLPFLAATTIAYLIIIFPTTNKN